MSEWISVEDRLPDEYADVLVVFPVGSRHIYEVDHVEDGGWFWNASEVTHWMPLPEPPQ